MNRIDEIAVQHHFGDREYVKQMTIPAGFRIATHKHVYEHLSFLIGTAEVTVDGVTECHTGPKMLTIKAEKHHGIKALTDCVWLCIHGVDAREKSNVDRVLILPSALEDMKNLAESL